MSECIPVSEVQVGDTIDKLIGYAVTVTDIDYVQEGQWGGRYYVFTAYSNISDEKKLYQHRYRSNDYVIIIGRNFEYEPEWRW